MARAPFVGLCRGHENFITPDLWGTADINKVESRFAAVIGPDSIKSIGVGFRWPPLEVFEGLGVYRKHVGAHRTIDKSMVAFFRQYLRSRGRLPKVFILCEDGFAEALSDDGYDNSGLG